MLASKLLGQNTNYSSSQGGTTGLFEQLQGTQQTAGETDFLAQSSYTQPQLQTPQRNMVSKGPGGRFVSSGNNGQKRISASAKQQNQGFVDLPGQINDNTRRPPATGQKRIKNPRIWTKDCIMTSVGSPILIKNDGRRKKYKISFRYINKADNTGGQKEHQATVCFGDKKQTDFVDHLDVDKRQATTARIRDVANKFRGGYWRVWLLNNKKTIQEAQADFKLSHGLLW